MSNVYHIMILEKNMKEIENSMKNLVDDNNIMEHYQTWVDARLTMIEFIREQALIFEVTQYKGEL